MQQFHLLKKGLLIRSGRTDNLAHGPAGAVPCDRHHGTEQAHRTTVPMRLGALADHLAVFLPRLVARRAIVVFGAVGMACTGWRASFGRDLSIDCRKNSRQTRQPMESANNMLIQAIDHGALRECNQITAIRCRVGYLIERHFSSPGLVTKAGRIAGARSSSL